MDSLSDILKLKDFTEPKEITAIKVFVEKRFQEKISVQLQKTSIIITVRSSALADTLRQLTPQIQQVAGSNKKLVFRIA